MRIMPGGGRIPPVPAWTAGLVAAIFLWDAGARAAELPTAELTVSRTPEAASCADENTLAGELKARMTATAAREPGPLRLGVELSTDGELFVATVRVEGRRQGIRTLRSKGPTCEGLHDALMVSLLLLLDEHPSSPDVPPPLPPTALPPAPPPATPPPPAPAIATAEPTRGPPPTLWLSAGGALTHGLPDRWWGAGSADVVVRYRSFEFSLGGVLAPRRGHSLADGRRVDVAFAGGRARGCYAFVVGAPRVSACAVAVASRLSGRGGGGDVDQGQDARTWWLFGAGPDAYFPVSSRIGIGISTVLLVPARAVTFYIDPNQSEAYVTDPVAVWIGADVRVRIW
jgi:hypothetical protein